MRNGYGEIESGLPTLLLFLDIKPAEAAGSNLVKKLMSDISSSSKSKIRRRSFFQALIFQFLESDVDMDKAIEALSDVMSQKTLPSATLASSSSDQTSSFSSPRKIHSKKFMK